MSPFPGLLDLFGKLSLTVPVSTSPGARRRRPSPATSEFFFHFFNFWIAARQSDQSDCDKYDSVAFGRFDRVVAPQSKKKMKKNGGSTRFGRDPVARSSSAKAPSPPRARVKSISATSLHVTWYSNWQRKEYNLHAQLTCITCTCTSFHLRKNDRKKERKKERKTERKKERQKERRDDLP